MIMETIMVNKNTKLQFEKERFNLRIKKRELVSQDEFIKMLIVHWRKK